MSRLARSSSRPLHVLISYLIASQSYLISSCSFLQSYLRMVVKQAFLVDSSAMLCLSLISRASFSKMNVSMVSSRQIEFFDFDITLSMYIIICEQGQMISDLNIRRNIINFIMLVITDKMEEMVAGADFGIKKSWLISQFLNFITTLFFRPKRPPELLQDQGPSCIDHQHDRGKRVEGQSQRKLLAELLNYL